MKVQEGLIALGVVLLWIILSPIWVPVFAYLYIDEKIDDYKFRKYLASVGSAKFFCYTNKQSSHAYVENNILPFLPSDVEVTLVSSRRWIDLGMNNKFPHRIVRKMAAMKKGFPCVGKISGGKLISGSVNQEVYNAIDRKKDAGEIVEKVNRFFEGQT